MNVSNKLLSFTLIITIFISVFSILSGLSNIDSLTQTSNAISDKGFIHLDILLDLSITTRDGNFIDFGNCKLLNRTLNITSEGTKDTFESCVDYERTNISVRNNGNRLTSISIKTNKVGALRGGDFLDSTSKTSDIAYKVTNEGRHTNQILNQGGCLEGLGPSNYTSFLEAETDYEICEVLNPDSLGGSNSVITNFEIVVPEDIEIGFSEIIITFTAQEYVPEE